MPWGTPVEIETRRRIFLTVAACAYEMFDQTTMSDEMFDAMCREVDLSIDTNRPDLDAWWRKEFSPHTGQWIWSHPELDHVYLLTEMVLGIRPWAPRPMTPGRAAELQRGLAKYETDSA